MSTIVAKMSVAELRELIEELLDERLEAILGDPDYGLRIRPEIREQLLRQKERVRQGDYEIPLSDLPD